MTKLESGIKATYTYKVNPENSAKNMGSGSLEVLATPALVAFMENAACRLVEGKLGEGMDSVGTRIDIKHIKASKIGVEVSVEVELSKVDGKKLEFAITAKEGDVVIGSSTHNRYVIEVKKFLERL
ncbi:MAG: thioesterase family protein [Marinifilaceae bacterium]|jgi:predicted thioesterase|nr:thioesterase family protein [Marinifilaceae bacterium]